MLARISRRSRSVIVGRVVDVGASLGEVISTNSMLSLEVFPENVRDNDAAFITEDFGVGRERRGGVSGSGELET